MQFSQLITINHNNNTIEQEINNTMEQEINNTMEQEINKVIQVCEIIRGLIYYNKNVI